jgi:hypothetical protein
MQKKTDCEWCSSGMSRRTLLKSTGALAALAGVPAALGGGSAAWAQGTSTGVPHIILFEHANFHGQHKHVFGREPNLNTGDDSLFNDSTSSIAVLEGNWLLYRDFNFSGRYAPILGPGLYPTLSGVDINNDDITSLQPTGAAATVLGAQILGHAILFEHANFHGRHKHLFRGETNLNASDDSLFNDRVSSIGVLAGNWIFYQDSGFRFPYQPILAPGLYPFVGSVGIRDNDISSAATTIMGATVAGERLRGEAILFQNGSFHAGHRHVLNAESNLNADDDRLFNDSVSSLTVLGGFWTFYRNAGFNSPYPRQLGVGAYPSVSAVGIANDDMSSLLAG